MKFWNKDTHPIATGETIRLSADTASEVTGGIVKDRINIRKPAPKTIGGLKLGQSGWVPPWLIYNREGYINLSLGIERYAGGSATLKVTCVGENEYRLDYKDVPDHQQPEE